MKLRVGDFDAASLVATLPEYGNWSVLAVLVGVEAPAKDTRLQVLIGDLVLDGLVTEAGVHAGCASAFVIGGTGGWQNAGVDKKSHPSNSGVRLDEAAAALAEAAGEKVVLEPDVAEVRFGQIWTRPAGAAIDALEDFGVPWWMAPDGVTHLGVRPSVTRTGPFGIESYDVAKGTAVLLPEGDGIAAAQPGSSLTANGTALNVRSCVIRASASRIAIEVNSGAVELLARVCDAVQSRARRRAQLVGPHVYRVQMQIGGLVYAQAQQGALNLPDYLALPIAFGLQGVKQSVSFGEDVLVVFQGGDISRPIVLGWRGGTPSETAINATEKIKLGELLGAGGYVEVAGGSRAVAMADAFKSWADAVHAFVQAAVAAAPAAAAAEATAYTAAGVLGWSATKLKVK